MYHFVRCSCSFMSDCVCVPSVIVIVIIIVSIGVDLAGILRGTHGERRRWVAVPNGVGYGEGCRLSSRLGVWGALWAPPAGSGAEPRPKTDFGVFWRPQNAPFCICYDKNLRGTICTSVPLLQILGGLVPPRSPVIYAHDRQLTRASLNRCSAAGARRFVPCVLKED